MTAKPTMRDTIRADVEGWPDEIRRQTWRDMVSTNGHGDWAKYSAAEVELRAWVETRGGACAVEPVVLNRHHLTPCAPQPTGKAWPIGAMYAGRPPSTAPKLDSSDHAALGWRISHLLHNPWPAESYPDALERFRLRLREWLLADKRAAEALAADPAAKLRRVPQVDAIRGLEPTAALVCSCVQTTPFTPAGPWPGALPPAVKCHCHLIIAAWRSLQRATRTAAAAPQPVDPRAAGRLTAPTPAGR